MHQIGASERVFEALYRNKHKLVTTRPLRLQLPRHPDPSPLEAFESAGNGVMDTTSLGQLDSTADPAEESSKLQQKQWEHPGQEHQGQETQQQQQREEENQLQLRQQQQQRERHEQEQRRQLQLAQSALTNTALSPTANSSPKRPHAIRRMASKVAAAVREGTRKIILLHSPRSSSWSPRAASLGTTAVDGGRTPGDGATEAKEGDDGFRAPAGGEAVETCPADSLANSSLGDVLKGPANPTTTDMAGTQLAAFFSEPRPQEGQREKHQGRQDHQVQNKSRFDCRNLIVLHRCGTR